MDVPVTHWRHELTLQGEAFPVNALLPTICLVRMFLQHNPRCHLTGLQVTKHTTEAAGLDDGGSSLPAGAIYSTSIFYSTISNATLQAPIKDGLKTLHWSSIDFQPHPTGSSWLQSRLWPHSIGSLRSLYYLTTHFSC